MNHYVIRLDKYDPEALDSALERLANAATASRDCLIIGDDDELRREFDTALNAISQAVHQISLKNRR